MKRSNWKNHYLILLLVSSIGCQSVPDVHPHFIDTQLEECREYEVTSKERWEIKYLRSHPLKKCNGYLAIPPQDAAALKAWWLSQQPGQQ